MTNVYILREYEETGRSDIIAVCSSRENAQIIIDEHPFLQRLLKIGGAAIEEYVIGAELDSALWWLKVEADEIGSR